MKKFFLHYVELLGWPVVPCRPGAKRPMTAHGVKDATTDRNVIDEWLANTPNANIAVPAGLPINAFILDIDRRNGGLETLRKFEETHGKLPTTAIQESGDSGIHYLFKLPQQKLRGKLGPGIDVLGTGKYFMVAPSKHPNGKPYRWRISPFQIRPIDAPEWLLQLAAIDNDTERYKIDARTADDEMVDRARKYLEKVPGAISGKGGHSHTFITAQRLVRQFGLSEYQSLELMRGWNAKCEPPWADWELKRKVREAINNGTMALKK